MESKAAKSVKKYLREAVAMEQSVLRTLDSMLATTDDPELERAFEEHKRTTRQHVDRLGQRLRAYGASPSRARQVAGALGARAKSAADMARRDKAGRSGRDGFVAEQTEVAAYELLERIAHKSGDEQTADVARQNRTEDEAMAGRIAKAWDRFADLSLGGGGSSSAGRMTQLTGKVATLARNPLAVTVASVGAGALLAHRSGSGGRQLRAEGGESLQALTKSELQERAEQAGIPVRRSMTKQDLVDALKPGA